MAGGAFLILIMILLSFVMTALTVSHFRRGTESGKVTLMIMACALSYFGIFDCISSLTK